MSKLQFHRCRFVTSAVKLEQYPLIKSPQGDKLPEIAVAGRSNVGKSSLLNHLFKVKNMVKTSSTPGKTQLLNFFSVDEQVVFVDLPGYGYAKVPVQVRAKWGPMVQQYLMERENLQLLLFLFDIRRQPNQEDYQLLQWLAETETPTLLVFTKADKLTRQQRQSSSRKLSALLGLDEQRPILYSVTKNLGRQELIAAMGTALRDIAESQENSWEES